jgi:putative ABC transport system permease protein
VRSLFWWLAERRIRRALPPQSVDPALGDLAEDFAAERQRSGAIRAAAWLMFESRSLAAAYQTNGNRRTAMMRASTFANQLRDDARLAIRRLRRQRAATIASILTLACAIAAGAVTWTLVSAVLLHPLPLASADRLVVVSGQYSAKGKLTAPYMPQLYPTFEAIERGSTFDLVAGEGTEQMLMSTGGPTERRTVCFASHGFFDVLGIRIAPGRGFQPEDDRRGAALTAILSDRLWRSAFQGDPGVLGRQVTVAGKSATIIGIAPARFRGINLAEFPDLYLPLRTIADVGSPFNNYFAETTHGTSPSLWITIVGRLKPGASADQAREQLQALPSETRQAQIISLVPISVAAISPAMRPKIRDFARLLASTVGLLLLIGGLTVGLLLLIRTEARRDEFAMCLALGASRQRLAAGVAVEGALLALAGSLLALPLAWTLFRSLATFKLPGGIDIGLLDLSLNWRVVLAASTCAAGMALLASGVAALFGFAADTADALRARAGATPRLSRRRTRSALVIAQVAVTLVLLAGAGLFARSLIASMSLNPGYETSRLLDVNLGLMSYGYSPERTTEFAGRLRAGLSEMPGITSVAIYQAAGAMTGNLTIDGQETPVPSTVEYNAVDERYFPTLGLRILRGRNFTQDDRADAPLAIIVSQSLGRVIAGDGDPVGHHIREDSRSRDKPFAIATVVGVVPDIVTNVNALEPLSVYYAVGQRAPGPNRRLLVRAAANADNAKAAAREVTRSIDPAVSLGPVLTLADRISQQMGPQQFAAMVLGVLGFIAVLLTVLGAYVLAESMAALRHRETGIRAALGATQGALTRMLAGQTMRLIGAGLLVGLGLSWAGTGLVRGFLFQVKPLDPATLMMSSALIAVTAFGVCLRPALTAARADLTKLLKDS